MQILYTRNLGFSMLILFALKLFYSELKTAQISRNLNYVLGKSWLKCFFVL